MNKKILAAGLVAGVVIGSHAAFWVYESGVIKSSVEKLAGRVSREIGGKNMELSFSGSEVSGYPMNFVVKLNQPKITSTGGGEKLELSSVDEQLVITSSLTGDNYEVALPSKIDVKSAVEAKEMVYKLVFADKSPKMDLKISGNMLFVGGNTDILQYINDNLKELAYSDSGYSLNNIEGTKIASSGKQAFKVTQNKNQKKSVETAYNIKIENLDSASLFANSAASSGLWPITASIDLSSIDEKDEGGKNKSIAFVVRDIDVSAASFGVGIKGEVKANGDDVFPFGNLSIKLSNYQNLVDYSSTMLRNALAETNIPFFNIKNDKSIDFKKLLSDVASEKSNDDKDILLNLTREKGKSLFVGQKGIMEVMDTLKATSNAEETKQPAKDSSKSIVTEPLKK